MATEYNAVISDRHDLDPLLGIFRITPKGWEFPDFKPGQFCTIGLPASTPRCVLAKPEEKPSTDPHNWIKRAYSIASSPKNRDYLELFVALVAEGVLTPRLWTLKVGDPIWLGPKIVGNFTMDEVPEDKNVILVGTGTGLAPYMSMLHTYFRPGSKQRFAIFHGCRKSQDLAYRTELKALESFASNFNYFPIISRPHTDPIPWKSLVGHVQVLWKEKVVEKAWSFKPSPDNTRVFLCGSPGMISDMVKFLEEDGFKEHKKTEPGQIYIEKYW